MASLRALQRSYTWCRQLLLPVIRVQRKNTLNERKPLSYSAPALQKPQFSDGVDVETLRSDFPADVEVSYEDYKYVEQLLPSPTVNEVPEHDVYPTPSGWLPPNDELRSQQKFLVRRTKNHMLPVYGSHRTIHGRVKHVVKIGKIEGDIWILEAELRSYLTEKTGVKNIKTQVHEVGRFLRIRGDYAPLVADFLLERGM